METQKRFYETPSTEVIVLRTEKCLLDMSNRGEYQDGGDPFADSITF